MRDFGASKPLPSARAMLGSRLSIGRTGSCLGSGCGGSVTSITGRRSPKIGGLPFDGSRAGRGEEGYSREGWARRCFENWVALKWQRLKPFEKLPR
jgi:hypothetical protein